MMDFAPRNPAAATRLSPGDVVAIRTERGVRHVQVTHARAPHPDVIRAMRPATSGSELERIAAGRTAFVAMVELGRVLSASADACWRMGRAPVPAADQAFPTFRLAIRDRTGAIVYWWRWDGEGLAVDGDDPAPDLPIREVLAFDRLQMRLASLDVDLDVAMD